eukprot:m.50235 g.50235  ORF g.50235 m.50235 type:complete len:53 (-) comp21236_c0_seq1:106-264(-)
MCDVRMCGVHVCVKSPPPCTTLTHNHTNQRYQKYQKPTSTTSTIVIEVYYHH